MAESTLSLRYQDLAGEVGAFFGFGRGPDFSERAWTASEKAAIDSAVKSGLRQFYFPPPIDGEGTYEWSFLRPVRSLSLAQAADSLLLPDDFGGIEGQVTLSATSSQVSWPLPVVNEETVRERFALTPDATGRPMYVAVRPDRDAGPNRGQRHRLLVFPKADQGYTLQVAYYVHPDTINGVTPYPLGGMAHAETVLESCLAVAEQRTDDTMGVHTQKYAERLRASISQDRRLKPQLLGYNADRSDRRNLRREDLHWFNRVTVGGTQY